MRRYRRFRCDFCAKSGRGGGLTFLTRLVSRSISKVDVKTKGPAGWARDQRDKR
jgi:hypothetical protein